MIKYKKVLTNLPSILIIVAILLLLINDKKSEEMNFSIGIIIVILIQSVAIGIMVPKEEYARASGMNSFSSNLLSVITPMLATSLLSIFGLKGILLIDVITFLYAESILLCCIKIPENNTYRKEKQSVFKGCKEGFQFLYHHKGIYYIVLSMACMNFLSRLTYENILSPMILARSGGNTHILGFVTGMIGFGGILGGILVSFRKKRGDIPKEIFITAAFSFLCGDLLMGIGQNVILWCIAALGASMPIPFIVSAQNVIMYETVPREVQGRIFAVKNAIQFSTIPIGIILGGFLAEYVFELFLGSQSRIAILMQGLVGKTEGSGMALMFVMTGILGSVTSLLWYKSKEISKLKKN